MNSPHLFSNAFKDLIVVELGSSVAAPYAAQILAELGARVIKVEKPQETMPGAGGPLFGKAPLLFSRHLIATRIRWFVI